MEDAVESLVVEEESKKLIKSKSIFQRLRGRSTTDNNNGTDAQELASTCDKMTPNEDANDLPIVTNNTPKKGTLDNQPKCNGVKTSILNGIKEKGSSQLQKNSSCLLLRLFESKLFDMSIAMSYLFKSKESGVQAYLGNKLFVSICYLFLPRFECDFGFYRNE